MPDRPPAFARASADTARRRLAVFERRRSPPAPPRAPAPFRTATVFRLEISACVSSSAIRRTIVSTMRPIGLAERTSWSAAGTLSADRRLRRHLERERDFALDEGRRERKDRELRRGRPRVLVGVTLDSLTRRAVGAD